MDKTWYCPFPLHRSLALANDSDLGELLLDQIDKMAEEFDEVADCLIETSEATAVNASGMLEETLDLIHAAWGLCYLLERVHPTMKVEDYITYVREKNRARGYYDA